MAELKTKANARSVSDFVKGISDPTRRKECETVLAMMNEIPRKHPKKWGESIVGFGSNHYRYESGREGEWFLTGFSLRKQNLTIHIMPGVKGYPEFLRTLGPYNTGASCLYLKGLEGIRLPTLKRLTKKSVEDIRR